MEIGFESSITNVNEDAGAVSVCAAVALQSHMESGRSLSVTFSTASGSMFYSYYFNIICLSCPHSCKGRQ